MARPNIDTKREWARKNQGVAYWNGIFSPIPMGMPRDRTLDLLLHNALILVSQMERETGIEPATSSLGSLRSTAELLPLGYTIAQSLK